MGDVKWTNRTFPVLEMSCAACAVSVESIVAGQKGVRQASVNYASQTLQVEYDPGQTNPQAIRQAVQSIGYDLILEEENAAGLQQAEQLAQYRQTRRDTIGAGLLAWPVFVLGMFFMHLPAVQWIMLLLALPVVFWFGRRFFIHAWKQARHGKANMDTLVALSTGIAFLFSVFNTANPAFWVSRGLQAHVYFEAAAVVVFFILLGKLLEERAKANTSSAIKKLMGLQPKTVFRVRDNGALEEMPIARVVLGDRLLVKPGDKIPVDGIVVEGSSYVDESMISGEPVPVFKQPGVMVYAGTLNQKGSFQLKAEKVGGTTLLAQIIRTVQQAQGSKAPVQKQVDKIAGIFVPAVLAVAVLTFAAWLIFGGANALTHGLLAAVTVLVIACPCALGLATPTAIIAGVGRGASLGILIKDAQSLETAHRVQAVVLDKTGTITAGKPQFTGQRWWVSEQQRYEKILFAIESRSEHPLAEAIADHFREQADPSMQVTGFESMTGLGVRAVVQGKTYFIGNQALLDTYHVPVPGDAAALAVEWQNQARTALFFADEKTLLAQMSVSDPVKPTSAGAVRRLLDAGLQVYLLSGDDQHTVDSVARQVGISAAQGQLLPAEKAAFIQSLQQKGMVVAMAGDGINDAEAMVQADVSIAMGQGSDIALETAKMALLTSDLQLLPAAFRLSKKTVITIRQNLFWAFFYNVIGIPIAAGILYPINGFLLNPMIAGAAMALSSVSVVSNSLRLRKIKL